MAKAKKQSTTRRAARKADPTRAKIKAFRARFKELANDAAAIVPPPAPADEKREAIIHSTISDLETAIIDIDCMASILLKLGEGRFQDSEIYSYLGGKLRGHHAAARKAHDRLHAMIILRQEA